MHPATPSRLRLALSCLIAFHILIFIVSNFLVQLPITLFGLHTTWGDFSFPFIFLATDLTVRLLGKQAARRVIARVMLPALVVSYVLPVLSQEAINRGVEALSDRSLFGLRMEGAGFLAYVVGQLLEIQVFHSMRKLLRLWIAPTAAMIVGNLIDT